jgi:protein phosphatase
MAGQWHESGRQFASCAHGVGTRPPCAGVRSWTVTLVIPEPSLVLLVGPSGAGKSTFARAHFRPTEIISSDDLRAWVADNPDDQAASADAFRILALVLNGRLRRRLTAVVDATNLRARNRRRLTSLAVRHGVPVVAIVFDFADDVYFANNARRPDRRVEEDVVADQVALLREAILDLPGEGYAAVYLLNDPGDVVGVVIGRRG